ncbi:lipopolysaccharide assembly protein LapA domain-containing protein [Nodosilinea sp. E11]|uniref:lipopolysaccharide assembly protein LapA domain-containing protein n=1 Tax=Nodosilinea sp. E11 TaxID=3037479 RepID=UPI002934CC5B|nr:lipopolysaccharide assembly protein LapA domain-containing protein [Nodosilinea sp. E11]WOD38368.1 lipopolysaccharide assembly protein LapA domain-containing protein [Nodosilinea sp. E11]
MIRLALALVPAVWVIAIAIIAVQNATPVSIRLLNLQSIELPFGVLLAFCVAGGMLAAALLLLVLGGNPLRVSRRKRPEV